MQGSEHRPANEQETVVDAVLRASRVLVAVAARSLADAAEEVTLTQYRSLVVLASRGPQSVAALAEAVAVTPPTASRLCDRLVRKGLVRRRQDRQDRRQVRLALTGSGRELVDAVTDRRRQEIATLLGSISREAQDSVVAALQELSEAAGEVPEQDWSTGWDLLIGRAGRRLRPQDQPAGDADPVASPTHPAGRVGRVLSHGSPRPPRPTGSTRARALGAAGARWVASASYLKKWIVLSLAIGAVAGVGAIVFFEALVACTHLFLGILAGYQVPTPAAEGSRAASAAPARPWALPLVVGLGALLGAILVHWIAPEAAGHGTDAAIDAVHHNPRGVRFRAVLVKIVASALTIGSGGSGGREGPTGQISAGFGSLLARVLDLEPTDARIAVATGIGSGIGAIFGAPLGGAVLAAEILYRDDFDPTALLPCFIASSVSSLVFGAVEGYSPIFGHSGGYHLGDPSQLMWFALIGVLGGLIGLLYAKGFYGIAALFRRSPLPRWVNPAVGGLIVGATALVIPELLGTGYGWVQQSLGPQLSAIPLWIVLVLPFARIVATGLSIGSGGSGGIFGPGMVIGAFVGAAVWRLFEPVVPSMGHDPAPYVIVGMMCCFGGISRAPLAVMLMVAEMTGSLSIVAPAMVAVGLAWLIVRRTDDTIYRSQLRSRADSPACPGGRGADPG